MFNLVEIYSKNKRVLILFVMALMLIFPLILILLPKTYFDQGPTLCLYTLLTGNSCFGCGTTRACMRLIHLDFVGAWEFNKVSFIVFPTLIFYYLRYFASKSKQLWTAK